MKLFVWENVLRDYTSGLAVVYAEDYEEAIKIMEQKFPNHVLNELPFTKCKIITRPDAFYVYGGG